MSAAAAQTGQRLTYAATLERIVEHSAPATRSLFLRVPPAPAFAFRPGQFISCLLPLGPEPAVRPYSIASDPEDPTLLEICLNLVPGGAGSAYLFSLRPGAVIQFTGPWGTFVLDEAPAVECVFIADGTGIAPIRPMLRRAWARGAGGSLRLHAAAADTQLILFRSEWEAAARQRAWFGFEPLTTVQLPARIEERYVAADPNRERRFYICGVGAIVPQLRDMLRGAGYERRAVQYEKW